MSNLSWLNPTPHAIAVYASQPLSPATTQHSLPSGRYSLLGPDFHRLDRTSLRLAHLLDHLFGDDEQRWRDDEAECLGSCQVERNHWTRLPAASVDWFERPVTLPPGRVRLATKPTPTGSPDTAKTIGICEGSGAIGAKRTCRERRQRVDLTKMTHSGH
jgi:hypothetical protein